MIGGEQEMKSDTGGGSWFGFSTNLNFQKPKLTHPSPSLDNKSYAYNNYNFLSGSPIVG